MSTYPSYNIFLPFHTQIALACPMLVPC